MTIIGLCYDCPRCGARHLIACCHASRHSLCDQCVRDQRVERAGRIERGARRTPR